MEELRITLLQTEMVWEEPEKNRELFSEWLKDLTVLTDLVILPEMFTTGFSMNSKALAEDGNSTSLKWMQKQAQRIEAAFTGSVIVKDQGEYRNRLYFVFPNGDYKIYDKRHLFTYAAEDQSYTAGKEKLIVDYRGWRICPLICFDLRFPVWARNIDDYDLLLYIANWPESRILHWDTLLRARSIENLCYTAGVNRIGRDGNDLEYNGHSAVYDAIGKKISTPDWEEGYMETLTLTKTHLKATRKTYPFLKEKDAFKIL